MRNAERPSNGRGRPSKLSDELKKELLQGIETGLTYELACNRVGITYRTFRNWMRKGEAAKSGELFHFFQEVRAAEARGATALLMLIRRSANEGQWQAPRSGGATPRFLSGLRISSITWTCARSRVIRL